MDAGEQRDENWNGEKMTKWHCCWTSEVIPPAGCPHISEEENDLRYSLKRRFLDKCLDCPRFREDLKKLAEVEPHLAAVFRYLIEEFIGQKEQMRYVAGFLDSRNREIQFLHELGVVLQTSMELDEVVSVAMTAITAGKGFGLNRAFLLLTDEEKRQLKGYVGVGPRSSQEAWQIWEDIGRNDFSLREMAANFLETKFYSEKIKFQDILNRLIIPVENQAHILNRTLLHGKPVLVQDAFNDAGIDPELAKTLGVETFLILPLISRKRRIGVILADNFITRKPITTKDMESMEILAFPLALAIERASLYERLQDDLEKLTEANNKLKEQQELIVKMEKMALVGKVTSSIAHSIRNPLMIIGGFARSLQKAMGQNDPKSNYVDSILLEAKKLEDTLTEVLGYADSLFPAMDMWDINEIVSNVVRELQEKMESQSIISSLELDKNLPMAFVDYKQMSFCLRKIIGSAMESLSEGGTIIVKTSFEEDNLVLQIWDQGRSTGSYIDGFTPGSSLAASDQIGALSVSLCKMILEKNSLSFHMERTAEGGVRYIVRLPTKKEGSTT